MILHLGGDVAVPSDNIITILNTDTINISDIEKKLNINALDIKYLCQDTADCKSVIITMKGNRCIVYYSPISSATLYKRGQNENEDLI